MLNYLNNLSNDVYDRKLEYKSITLSFMILITIILLQRIIIGRIQARTLFIPILLVVVSFNVLIKHQIDVRVLKITYLIRLMLLVILSIIISIRIGGTKLLDIYPDQVFYITTAQSIANEISINNIFINSRELVGLHNRLYNVVGGYLTYINKGDTILVYQFINFFVHSLIIQEAIDLYNHLKMQYNFGEETDFSDNSLIVLFSFTPSFLVFTYLNLRDIMIAYALILFFNGIFIKKKEKILISVFLSYYLRRQLPLVMATSLVIFHIVIKLFNKEQNVLIRLTIFIFSLIICVSFFQVFFPNYFYLIEELKALSIIKFIKVFFLSFFSLIFLIPGASPTPITKIAIAKIFTPEVFLIPFSSVFFIVKYRIWRNKECLYFLIFIILYSFGYYVEYGKIATRHFFPFYPILIVFIIFIKNIPKENTGLSLSNLKYY